MYVFRPVLEFKGEHARKGKEFEGWFRQKNFEIFKCSPAILFIFRYHLP